MMTFEKYPIWIIFLSNVVSLSIYGIGAFVVWQVGIVWLILYVLYLLVLEIRLLRHCRDCYYYEKACAFGKGKLSGLIFKKGTRNVFTDKKFTWIDILPDFLVSLIPIVIGIVLLIRDFNWPLLILLLLLLFLSSTGTGYIRASLACKFCKQRELGCPAAQLFGMRDDENRVTRN